VNTETQFLDAIRANPDDDTARLVYADWLDEEGTTDQQRARSEWIRLVCFKQGSQGAKKTGERRRIPGEPAWLLANAHRLWPNLFALKAAWRNEPVHVALTTGRVVLALALPHKRANRPGGSEGLAYTHVGLDAERGVCTGVSVTFLRAARVAPAAALDEPTAPIQFASPNQWPIVVTGGLSQTFLTRKRFATRGIADVWEGIDAPERHDFNGGPVKVFEGGTIAERLDRVWAACDESLTRWARERAADLGQSAEGRAAA
jgi:uncharacterized protein (TIGR02996 family)